MENFLDYVNWSERSTHCGWNHSPGRRPVCDLNNSGEDEPSTRMHAFFALFLTVDVPQASSTVTSQL